MAGLESGTKRELFRLQRESTTGAAATGPQFPVERAELAVKAFESAEGGFSVDLPLAPNAPEILDGLLKNALLLVDNGDYKLASNILRNILVRDPHYPEAIEWLGYCFNQLGDRENALKCFTELVKTHPDEFSFSALAETLYSLGREQEADHYYRLALGEIRYDSPLLFNIHKNLGNISVKSGDLDAAEENYNKAYTICPHSDALFVNYGTLELQRGNLDAALERFREAVKLNGKNEKAWIGIALIHRQMGDFELAMGNLENALDIDAANPTALRVYAEWTFESHQYEKAIQRLKGAMTAAGGDVGVSLLLIEAFFRAGDWAQCRLELERAKSLDPNRPEVWKYEELLEKLGNDTNA